MVTDPIKFVYVVGDGTTTDFSYAFNGTVGFDADVAEDVRAAILNPDGTRDTNPNFAVLKDTYGNFTGAIRFATAPVANAVVYIYRATPQTQETEYRTSSGFDAKVVEENFDKITKILQEISLHAKNKTVQLDPFQEQKIALELLSASNNGQYLMLDIINWVIKAGLFLEITSDNRFRVSKDGKAWIYLPKSENIQEIRQREYLDEKGIRHLVFEYRVGEKWYDVLSGVSHTGLLDRDAEDSHPISAITGLQEKLTTIDENIDKKLDINQGTENVGRVLKVDEDGNIIASTEAAGLAAVNHDETMEGAGTESSPLKVSQSVLSEIAGKQPAGDYATREELEQGLAEKANTSDVVDKTSDQTINGRKTFEQPIVQTSRGLALHIINNSGAKVASFGSYYNVANQNEAFMYVYNDDGSINSWLSLYYNNGASYAVVGPTYNIPTSDNKNKLASTSFVHALLNQVINDSNIGSNYVYIGDLLIQWGYTERKSTIDLIKPFANTDYFVSMQNISSVNISGFGTDLINIKALNTTSFELNNLDDRFPIKWIAIGQGA